MREKKGEKEGEEKTINDKEDRIGCEEEKEEDNKRKKRKKKMNRKRKKR